MDAQLLGPRPRHAVKNQAGGEDHEGDHHQRHGQHPGRQLRHEAGGDIVGENRGHEAEARGEKHAADQAEKAKGRVSFISMANIQRIFAPSL